MSERMINTNSIDSYKVGRDYVYRLIPANQSDTWSARVHLFGHHENFGTGHCEFCCSKRTYNHFYCLQYIQSLHKSPTQAPFCLPLSYPHTVSVLNKMAWYAQKMGQPVPMAQPAYPFDTQRDAVLVSEFPSIRDATHTATSTTKSRHRLRWRVLQPWNNFENQVIDYFTTAFNAADRAALIITATGLYQLFAAVNDSEARTEGDIKSLLLQFILEVHNIAARGKNGAPLPSDSHASVIRIEAGAGSYGLVGVSDFGMYHDTHERVCLVGEAKNPWNVTPQKIDEVLNGNFYIIFVNNF
jgi:hypothetical protein